jgi:hypothetical protein
VPSSGAVTSSPRSAAGTGGATGAGDAADAAFDPAAAPALLTATCAVPRRRLIFAPPISRSSVSKLELSSSFKNFRDVGGGQTHLRPPKMFMTCVSGFAARRRHGRRFARRPHRLGAALQQQQRVGAAFERPLDVLRPTVVLFHASPDGAQRLQLVIGEAGFAAAVLRGR